jgi:hypothetical protein
MGSSVSVATLVAVEPTIMAVRRAAVLLGIEGVALLAIGVVLAAATAPGSPDNRGLS